MDCDSGNPRCARCGALLSSREVEICRAAPQRFAGGLFCREHQRRFSACPAVRGGLLR